MVVRGTKYVVRFPPALNRSDKVLTVEEDFFERQAAEYHDIDFISFPIPDRGGPASMQDAVSLIARIGAQLEAGQNVAVHCRQGIGRSGLIAAGVLMTSGTGPEEAMQIVSSARGVPVPETLAQRQWTEQLLSGLSVPKR